jgi:hypothetical protein
MAQFKTAIPPDQKTIRRLEQGRYTATDVRWEKVLDLSGADNQSLIAFGFHGWENQQARVFFSLRLQEELIVALSHARSTTIVGVSSLRGRFRHQQRQEWLVPRSSRLEGVASGGKCGSRHGGLPDVLGSGGHG